MKKYIILSLALIAVVVGLIFASSTQQQPQYLRIHIRANSNSNIDQNVKYQVKEAVVDAISPKLQGIANFDEACEIMNENLQLMQNQADMVLKKNGFDYTSTIRLAREEFPTREYQGLTLESGVYDALIIELGSGTGDNWWCVVFPPLCFAGAVDDEGVEYKSFVVEKYKKFVEKRR